MFGVLESTLSEEQAQTGLHGEESDQVERALRGPDRRNDWRTENVHLGEEKAMAGEADNCLENSERLSCEKETRCIFYVPTPKDPEWPK